MYLIIVLLYNNFLQVSSYRQTSPSSRIIKEVINEEQYSTTVNSSFLLQFSNYFGIIDISLSSQNQESFIQITKGDPQNSHLSSGCQPYDRVIQYEKLFNFIPLFDNETLQGNISSLYSSTYNIFILRSDLKLFIVKLQYDLEIQEILDFQQVFNINLKTIFTNQSENQQIQDPVLKCYQNNVQIVYCYVFSQLGTIHFQYNQEVNKILVMKQVRVVELSSKILDVYLDNINRLLLVLSQREVQVYQLFFDGGLNLIQNLIPIKEANLIQVKTNENGTHIFILDQQSGILIYQIDKQKEEITLSDQNISIKGGRAFDFFGDIMFILLETEDELPYVLELFYDYDLEKREHYLNKITSYEQEIYDLYVDDKLTILIGNELHSIIENSIYHGFYENENQSKKQFFFNQIDLIQVHSLKLPWNEQIKFGYPFENGLFKSMKLWYDETYIVSISEMEVNLFILKSISPWVLCMPENITKEFYQLRIKSQKCPYMKDNNHNPFIICDSIMNFSLQGQEVYFYEENSKLFLIIVGIVMFTIIGLSIILLFYKNRNQKLDIVQEQGSIRTTQMENSYLKTENEPTMK